MERILADVGDSLMKTSNFLGKLAMILAAGDGSGTFFLFFPEFPEQAFERFGCFKFESVRQRRQFVDAQINPYSALVLGWNKVAEIRKLTSQADVPAVGLPGNHGREDFRVFEAQRLTHPHPAELGDVDA